MAKEAKGTKVFGEHGSVFFHRWAQTFLGGRAVRKSQVAGRESTSLIATTQWLATMRVKVVLCLFVLKFLFKNDACRSNPV